MAASTAFKVLHRCNENGLSNRVMFCLRQYIHRQPFGIVCHPRHRPEFLKVQQSYQCRPDQTGILQPPQSGCQPRNFIYRWDGSAAASAATACAPPMVKYESPAKCAAAKIMDWVHHFGAGTTIIISGTPSNMGWYGIHEHRGMDKMPSPRYIIPTRSRGVTFVPKVFSQLIQHKSSHLAFCAWWNSRDPALPPIPSFTNFCTQSSNAVLSCCWLSSKSRIELMRWMSIKTVEWV